MNRNCCWALFFLLHLVKPLWYFPCFKRPGALPKIWVFLVCSEAGGVYVCLVTLKAFSCLRNSLKGGSLTWSIAELWTEWWGKWDAGTPNLKFKNYEQRGKQIYLGSESEWSSLFGWIMRLERSGRLGQRHRILPQGQTDCSLQRGNQSPARKY